MSAACEVCGGPARFCRFETGCSCWYGIPCHDANATTKGAKGRALRARLAHHVSGAIARGEATPIVGIPSSPTPTR